MRKVLMVLLVLALVALTTQLDASEEKEWTLLILPGEEYSFIKWYGPFPIRKKPLIAVWLEDRDGRLLKTLYLSDRAAQNKWIGKADKRPESLPVYFYSRSVSDHSESIDTISASSRGNQPEARSFPDDFPEDIFRIRAEVNISYDFNDFYTREKTDVNGQPSLVYQDEWSGGKKVYSLKLSGTGSIDGSDGEIEADLSHLTTALKLLDSIVLRW